MSKPLSRLQDGMPEEVVERIVKPSGERGAHIMVPRAWLGKTVRATLAKPGDQ